MNYGGMGKRGRKGVTGKFGEIFINFVISSRIGMKLKVIHR